MSNPVRLTDDELSAIMLACQPLAPEARDGFVQAVAAGLRGHVVGPGLVHRVVFSAVLRSAGYFWVGRAEQPVKPLLAADAVEQAG